LGPGEDEVGKRGDGNAWDIEACTEVIPEADAELGAGLGEGEEGIAGIADAPLKGTAEPWLTPS
jgi:hypothetical protein